MRQLYAENGWGDFSHERKVECLLGVVDGWRSKGTPRSDRAGFTVADLLRVRLDVSVEKRQRDDCGEAAAMCASSEIDERRVVRRDR